jgi:hypothetical protein
MRGRPAFALAIALVATLAASSPSADAKGKERLEFQLRTSNGYQVRLQASDSTAVVVVSRDMRKGDLGFAESAYVVRARTGANGLRATFGDRGQMRMRFRPSGRARYGPSRRPCRRADRRVTRFGTFVGTFRFTGENGYTKIRIRRVRGRVVSPASPRCRRSFGRNPRGTATIWKALAAPPVAVRKSLDRRAAAEASALLGGPSRRVTFLGASWRQGLTAQSFGAIEIGPLGTLCLAAALHTEGRLGVFRIALAAGSPASLSVDDSLSLARVRPPLPFSGSATFEHFDDGTTSWTGTLAVSFPGAPRLPLTGPPFKAKLRRAL